MAYRLDYERASMVLVEALFYGDEEAGKRWGLTPRTIINYRNRLKEDKELSRLFAIKKERFESDWVSEIPAAMRSGTRFLLRAFRELDATPENVHAVAGAMKIMAEIGLAKELIDARLGKLDREDRETNNEMATLILSGDEAE